MKLQWKKRRLQRSNKIINVTKIFDKTESSRMAILVQGHKIQIWEMKMLAVRLSLVIWSDKMKE